MFSINLRCLGHVVNLGNVDVMAQITKLAAVENATAIWEYDPTQADNRVLGGSLDVIAAICTLAIKVKIGLIHTAYHILTTPSVIRFKPLGNERNISRALKFDVAFLKL